MTRARTARRLGSVLSHVTTPPAAAEAEAFATPHAEEDDDFYADSIAALALETELPVVVFEAVLPRQRVEMTVRNDGTKRLLRALAAEGRCLGVVGRDPASEAALSFGCECEVARAAEQPDGSLRAELVGRRCFSVDESRLDADGCSVASVSWAYTAPPPEAEPEVELQPVRAAAEQLYALVDEWLWLVPASGAERHPDHMCTHPPSTLPAAQPALTSAAPGCSGGAGGARASTAGALGRRGDVGRGGDQPDTRARCRPRDPPRTLPCHLSVSLWRCRSLPGLLSVERGAAR